MGKDKKLSGCKREKKLDYKNGKKLLWMVEDAVINDEGSIFKTFFIY